MRMIWLECWRQAAKERPPGESGRLAKEIREEELKALQIEDQ